jgi:redox-sensitive bicupin YhaK (pirin superfamily)
MFAKVRSRSATPRSSDSIWQSCQPGGEVAISAKENASVILLGGEPLPEPTVIYWNFITDTVGEAKQAMLDWEAGKFPPVKKYVKISHDGDEQLEEKMKLL